MQVTNFSTRPRSITSFDVSSYSNVDMILLYTRAFMRILNYKNLIINKGFKRISYLKELLPDSEKAKVKVMQLTERFYNKLQ